VSVRLPVFEQNMYFVSYFKIITSLWQSDNHTLYFALGFIVEIAIPVLLDGTTVLPVDRDISF